MIFLEQAGIRSFVLSNNAFLYRGVTQINRLKMAPGQTVLRENHLYMRQTVNKIMINPMNRNRCFTSSSFAGILAVIFLTIAVHTGIIAQDCTNDTIPPVAICNEWVYVSRVLMI
jgi:hypothetical protein